jgi:site-specific recombinase XerD
MPNFWSDHWAERLRRELALRNYSDATCRSYVQAVTAFLDASPGNPRKKTRDTLCAYLLHLDAKAGLSASTRNLHRFALAFFYRHVLHVDGPVCGLPHIKGTQKLPDVFNPQQVLQLLDSLNNPKQRLMLAFAYGCGLRVSEIVKLKIADIDIARRLVLILEGKGRKSRQVFLPDVLAIDLETYLNTFRPLTYIFESRIPGTPLTRRTLQAVFESAKMKAGIKSEGGIHALRHSYATHLLENGTDLRYIQALLGHNNSKTTERYTRVLTSHFPKLSSPLDLLRKIKETE